MNADAASERSVRNGGFHAFETLATPGFMR